MQTKGLVPPWGIGGCATRDLEHSPPAEALNAGLEAVAAYHLWARATGAPDHIYEAAEDCGLVREAVRVFYPPDKTW